MLSKTKQLLVCAAFKAQYYGKKTLYHLRLRIPHLKRAHINTFPAVHLKKMDWLDFSLKFSSELLVLGMAIIVIGFSLMTFSNMDDFQDKSLAAKFLSYHPELNKQLYAKNTTIKTVVVRHPSFINEAFANTFEGLTPQSFDTENIEADNTSVISDEGLIKPDPDSVSALIAKQIKVYETKPNDTLVSIASQNGISVQTIMWANKLSSQNIKPGWFLVILPTDGVMHIANSNTTLPDLAKKYSGNLETIISYNGLENAEDIDAGQIVIIPGGKPQTPKPAPLPTRRANDGKVNPNGTVKPKLVDNGTGHIFPWGYCTWYVATRVHVPWGGNAKNWLANAKAYGAVISNSPSAGSIVVTTDNARYGHVAYVERVDDGRILVSEMNYEKFGKTNQRWISISSKTIRGYILP